MSEYWLVYLGIGAGIALVEFFEEQDLARFDIRELVGYGFIVLLWLPLLLHRLGKKR